MGAEGQGGGDLGSALARRGWDGSHHWHEHGTRAPVFLGSRATHVLVGRAWAPKSQVTPTPPSSPQRSRDARWRRSLSDTSTSVPHWPEGVSLTQPPRGVLATEGPQAVSHSVGECHVPGSEVHFLSTCRDSIPGLCQCWRAWPPKPLVIMAGSHHASCPRCSSHFDMFPTMLQECSSCSSASFLQFPTLSLCFPHSSSSSEMLRSPARRQPGPWLPSPGWASVQAAHLHGVSHATAQRGGKRGLCCPTHVPRGRRCRPESRFLKHPEQSVLWKERALSLLS